MKIWQPKKSRRLGKASDDSGSNYRDRFKLLNVGTAVLYATIALTALTAAPAGAATYFVNQTTGVDDYENPHSSVSAPYKSINCAAWWARNAGDVVLVADGVYRENVDTWFDGITFAAEHRGKVIISGADLWNSGWTRVTGAGNPSNDPIYRHVWHSVFSIATNGNGQPVQANPEEQSLWGRSEQVVVDGRDLLPTHGVPLDKSAHELHDDPDACLSDLIKQWHHAPPREGLVPSPLPHLGGPFGGYFAADGQDGVLYIALADGSNPNVKHNVNVSTRDKLFGINMWARNGRGVDNVTLDGFTFRFGATFAQRGAVWLHGNNNLVRDCVIEDMDGDGIVVDGRVEGCVVKDCGSTGAGGDDKGCDYENCLFEGNSWKPINRLWGAGGIKIGGASTPFTFNNCAFWRNGGPGLWLDCNVQNATIEHCVFIENEQSGVMVEISPNNSVEDCLAIRNGIGAVGIPTDNTNNWADNSGIMICESPHTTVTHNTSVGNVAGIGLRQVSRPDCGDSTDARFNDGGSIFSDNICASNTKWPVSICWDIGSPYNKEAILMNDNLYWSSTAPLRFMYAYAQTYPSLSAWQAASNWDWSSCCADPGFINAAADDFRRRQSATTTPNIDSAGWADAPISIAAWVATFTIR